MRIMPTQALAEVRGVLGDARDHVARHDQDRPLTCALVGLPVPSVLLAGFMGEPVDVRDLAARSALTMYLYPGCGESPDGGEDSLMLDAVQHRAYDAHENGLSELGILAIGVSSPSWQKQRESAAATRVSHTLLSDTEFLLAESLGLPTFRERGTRWYRRLTMVILEGRIGEVFYPVRRPGIDPEQVLAWAAAQD